MKNWMDYELNEAQTSLVQAYEQLVAVLRDHQDRLAPYEEANARKAVAALWMVVNGLDLDPDQLYEIGV